MRNRRMPRTRRDVSGNQCVIQAKNWGRLAELDLTKDPCDSGSLATSTTQNSDWMQHKRRSFTPRARNQNGKVRRPVEPVQFRDPPLCFQLARCKRPLPETERDSEGTIAKTMLASPAALDLSPKCGLGGNENNRCDVAEAATVLRGRANKEERQH